MFKKIALWTVFTLILLAIGAVYWTKVDSGKQLSAIQERFRASGAPMTIAEALPDPVAAELNAAPLYLELEALTAHFNLSDEIYEKLTTLSEDEVSLAGIYLFKVSDAEWLLFEEMLRDERLLAQLELIEQIAAKPFFQPD